MALYTITEDEYIKLRKLIDEIDKKCNEDLKGGYISGAGQDGHHDEGYQLSKRNVGVSDTRLNELHKILNNATVIQPIDQDTYIRLGNGVIVEDNDGRKQRLIVCGYAGLPSEGETVSINSPLGLAILGKKIDDEVEVQLPETKKYYTIIKILRPSEAHQIYTI